MCSEKNMYDMLNVTIFAWQKLEKHNENVENFENSAKSWYAFIAFISLGIMTP